MMRLIVCCLVLACVEASGQVLLRINNASPVTISAGDLAKLPRHQVVLNDHGKQVRYEGALLHDVLTRGGVEFGKGLRGKQLSSYVAAIASDGYEVVYALAEIDPSLVSSDIIVADQREGQALSKSEGPLRIIAPHDARPARSLKMLREIDVVQLKKAGTQDYTADGRLRPQLDYREWVFLSSGLDMSYTPRAASMAGHSMFDNVFVNQEAYRSFLQSGTWPDGTKFVLEIRGAESNVSINKGGHSQSQGVMGVEMHVKDAARGGWAFYEFDGATPAKKISREASCYSCHQEHGAVDTTFVQFYPTLMRFAKEAEKR